MTEQEDRLALEGLLGRDGLDVRAARLEAAVQAQLESPPRFSHALLSAVGHPVLAAAAVIVCLILRANVNVGDPAGVHPTLDQVVGIGSGSESLEAEIAQSIPNWITTGAGGGGR